MPTRWVAAAIAVLAVLAITLSLPWSVVMAVVVALLGATAVDLVLARRQRPRLERTHLGVLARSHAVPFEAKVHVDRARSVRVRQPRPPELEVIPSEHKGTDLVGKIVGRNRGTFVLPPVTVRATGPLGLGACERSVGPEVAVTVWPDLPGARRMAIARRRGMLAEEGRIRARIGLGTEFETVRDYSPDDDIRRVNWIATARAGRPMSNQYRVEENRDLFCLVDTGRLMAAPIGEATRLDVALDAVAALAVAAEDAGDRVGTVAFADEITRVVRPRRKGAETVVRALFDLEPSTAESDYEAAFWLVGGHKRCLVTVFTDLLDEAAARTLLDAVPVLSRRHAVMVVSCRDPDIATAVVAPPRRPEDVFRAAAALDLLQSRSRAAALLRHMDAVVVEAPPDRLGAACVSGYLSLKRRARL